MTYKQEQREERNLYKEVPLTGAIQSLMPMYRSSASFGRICVPDEYGNYSDTAVADHGHTGGYFTCNAEFRVEENTREVIGFRMPDGEDATPEQIDEDGKAWATSFARDQRACHVRNHDHDCTGTCVKYQKKNKDAAEPSLRSGQKLKGPSAQNRKQNGLYSVHVPVIGEIRGNHGIQLFLARSHSLHNSNE